MILSSRIASNCKLFMLLLFCGFIIAEEALQCLLDKIFLFAVSMIFNLLLLKMVMYSCDCMVILGQRMVCALMPNSINCNTVRDIMLDLHLWLLSVHGCGCSVFGGFRFCDTCDCDCEW